jgi:Tfp pilus assembly protein PilX
MTHGAGMTRIRTWMCGETGIATPVVVAIMSVVMLLAAGGALAALGTNVGANEDRRSKRALAAAEAGIQQAAYRLAQLQLGENRCLRASGPPWDGAQDNGECTTRIPGTGAAAGEAFSYVVSSKLDAGDPPCAGQESGSASSWTDRCITSTGTVGEVARRLQAKVRVSRGGTFAGVGLVGLDFVTLVNSVNVTSSVGSNGQITGSNSINVNGSLQLAPNAPTPIVHPSSPPVVRRSEPWPVEPTDFAAIAAGPNNNAALNGLSGWNTNTRVLRLGNSVTITLAAGTYLMCDLYADNSITIKLHSNVTPTNPVRIYIDSPQRTGSGCAAGTGRFCLDNSVRVNDGGSAAELALYMYGSTSKCSDAVPGMPFDGAHFPSDAPFVLGNSAQYYGTVYAPTTRVKLNNSVTVSGSIVSKSAELANSVNFTYPSELSNQAPAVGPIQRVAWVECRSQATDAGDPESGCT